MSSREAGEKGIRHGGDLAETRALFPDAPEPRIDLSTGINPIPYPLPALPETLWARLPGRVEEEALLAAAHSAWKVPAGAAVVAAPGTQILIELLPRLTGGPVAILGPTYAEHAHAWRKAGRAVEDVDAIAGAAAPNVVLVNPNNPDGRLISRAALRDAAARCASAGGLLVVDEAFCDLTPEASLIPELPPGALVLRSFGKTYGLAGLRLGFAVGDPATIAGLRGMLGPWAVSGPALAIGARALADVGWLSRTARDRTADASRLDALLSPHGRVIGGTSLFRLIRTPAAPALFDHLGRAGIHLRRFDERPDWLRLGLPGSEPEWNRLAEALARFTDPAQPARSSEDHR